MKAIGIDVDDCDTEAGHRISKSKGNSKKTVAPFCNRKLSKRALYNKTKLASINTSAVGLGNSTKRFISKNLMDYNYKLVFKCRKIKRASLIYSTFTRDGVVHIMIVVCPKKISTWVNLLNYFQTSISMMRSEVSMIRSEDWVYNCWLIVFHDYMIIAFFSFTVSCSLNVNIYLKQPYG